MVKYVSLSLSWLNWTDILKKLYRVCISFLKWENCGNNIDATFLEWEEQMKFCHSERGFHLQQIIISLRPSNLGSN